MKIKKYWNISIVFSLICLITGYSSESAKSLTKNYKNSSENLNQVKERNYSWIKESCWTARVSTSDFTIEDKIYFTESNKYYSNSKTVATIPRFNNTSKLTGRWRQNGNLIIVKFDGERGTIANYFIVSENEIIRFPGTTVYVRGC